MKLSRADIEWLLPTHEQERGPVAYHDQSQRDRIGLDLRGADLSYAQVQNLPLARTLQRRAQRLSHINSSFPD